MSVKEFVENYLKSKGLKLEKHQKEMLKSIEEGKMIYYSGGRTTGKSVLLDALREYEKYKGDE